MYEAVGDPPNSSLQGSDSRTRVKSLVTLLCMAMMLQRHGRPRRGKGTLRITQLVRSQSLDVVKPSSVGSSDNGDLSSRGVEYGHAKSRLTANRKTGQTGTHKLSPLRRKNNWRPPVRFPAHSLCRKEVHRPSLERKQPCSPSDTHFSSIGRIGWPESESDWSAVIDIFVPAGGVAGIAFQWSMIPIPGLFVVDAAEGSLAAGHGGIVPGMLLLEIGGHRVAGMSQDETMGLLRSASGKTHVLTLARKSQVPTTGRCNPTTQAPPEDDFSQSARLDSVTKARMAPPVPSETLLSVSSSVSCVSHSSLPYFDGETSSAATSSVDSSVHADLTSAPDRRISNTPHHHAPRYERTLALRFVGTRGNIISLYDRDHVLGVKKRDIEFLPTGGMCSNMHRTNSQRSLGDLTLDWRRDPFSTPARRRRLINDVCKLVVSSYAEAAASRVAEFRREEAFVACIQAAVRMWSAWNRFRVEVAERRRRAALILQLGWLAYTARRRTQILRGNKDIARLEEEISRKKRLMRERDQEKVVIAREKMEQRKQQIRLASVVLLQRRFRAIQMHRRLAEKKRIQNQQRAVRVSKAAATIHVTFRRWGRKREASALILRDKMIKAACLIQRSWSQYERASLMNRPKPQQSEHFDASGSKSFYINNAETDSHVPTPRDTRATARDPCEPLASAEICTPKSPTFTDLQASRTDARGSGGNCLKPRNAARVPAMDPASTRVAHAPPTGMMEVRVKIGSERRNWFTSVVSRESDQTAPLVLAGTGSTSDADKNNDGRQRDEVVLSKTTTTTGAVRARVLGVQPSAEQGAKTVTLKTETIFLASQTEALQTRPRDRVGNGSRGEMSRSSFLGVISSNSSDAEQCCIMEDSQVYLGCARCGLKYLVESVDARLPESGTEQPAPEVLYLCTSCGDILRDEEDDRWQRRRRPSSAPAVGRRSAPYDGGSSSRRTTKRCQILPDGSSADHMLEERRSEITTAQESYEVGKSQRRSINIKLQYARCARIIQLAYKDFRRHQYLRDWALRVLCQWFPARIKALHRAKHRLRLHRAAVALQSFARAASARARSLLLRSTRRRLWMERAAALHWGLDDNTASPEAAMLLRELDASSLPPPPREFAPTAQKGERRRIVGGTRLAMAKALAPTITGPPPPGCPEPLEVDWSEWGIKLKLAFASRVVPPDS